MLRGSQKKVKGKIKMNKEPAKKEHIDTTIKIEHALKSQDVIALAIDKIGPKRVLQIILSQCLMNTLEKSQFPSSLLATAEDEEKAEVTAALYYLLKGGDWKKLSGKGMKMLSRKIEESNSCIQK